MMKRKRTKLSKGFTLIELLISMALLGILGIGVLSLQVILGQNQVLVINNYLSIDESNRNVTSFTKELRTAQPGENGAYALDITDDQEISFYSDYDFDGDIEKVRYFLDGTTLSKGTTEPSGYPVTYSSTNERVKILTENVRNDTLPLFYYYNGDWPTDTINNPLSTGSRLSDTRTVRIYVRLNTDSDKPDSDYVLESYVNIRMLKDNL